jgi:hypothetical protein
MLRREFVRLLAQITGGTVAATLAPPLLRINTTLLAEAQAQTCQNQPGPHCQQDCCSTSDICEISDAGHTCTTRDLCDFDASKDCTDDQCTSDTSGTCNGDRCVADSSADCTNDGGPACSDDACADDGSCEGDIGGCRDDWSGACVSDSSGLCQNDGCLSDKSGTCTNDVCGSDKSGNCLLDYCVSDSSGACSNDECRSDSSKDCQTDFCYSDSSGSCAIDHCIADSSGECQTDTCVSDPSGACWTDHCLSDKSAACKNDLCVSDLSGACRNDRCQADSDGANWDPEACPDDATPVANMCNSDYSGPCTQQDLCFLDVSASCTVDLCREDRSTLPCLTDTCSLDLALNLNRDRRGFAKAGLNQAIRWLYTLSIILLALSLTFSPSPASTVIDARNAVFAPAPTFSTDQAVTVPSPVGPFLRDCDGDGILEADTDGNGDCTGDPEIIVLDNTGGATWGLPAGAAFTGSFEFTCFHVSYRMAIVSTGPLNVKASQEVAIFGALRLAGDTVLSTPAPIDLRTSAWLSDGSITFITGQSGTVDETQTPYAADGNVPRIFYDSLCGRIDWGLFLPLILRAP